MSVWGNASLIEAAWTGLMLWSNWRGLYLLRQGWKELRVVKTAGENGILSYLAWMSLLSGFNKANATSVFAAVGILAMFQPEPAHRTVAGWVSIFGFLYVGLVYAVTSEILVYLKHKVLGK